jgi:hypothetical protein
MYHHPPLYYHTEVIVVKDKRRYLFLTLAVLILVLFIVFSVIRDVATDLEYEKMMENSGKYINRTFNIKGQTFEVMAEGSNNYSMYVFTRKKELEYDDDVIYLTGYIADNVKNGDVIACKAVLTGMTTFTKESGEQMQIPQLQYTK